MGRKRYDGYRSYGYLADDPGYRAFALAAEIGRVPPYDAGLSPEQAARVDRLMAESVVVSLHDHPIVRPLRLDDFLAYRRQGRDVTGFEGLSASGLDAVFDNLMDGTALITSRAGWKWDDILYDLGMRLSDIAHQDMLFVGRTAADARTARREGRIAWFPSLEAATPIENELDRLDILYGFGVRMIGVAYSESNQLGGGLREARDGGLSQFGRAAVRRMNQLGMLVDVSHAGDRTALDTIEASSAPVVISHAGARALWPSRRMKPDDVIRACAQAGGLIGIEAAPHTTITVRHPVHDLESVMEHLEYCAALVGIDAVALGPDTMFGDHVGSHRVFAGPLSLGAGGIDGPEHAAVPYVAGMENPAEAVRNAAGWLVKHGYSDADIAKVIGLNALRVMEAVLQ